MTQRSIIRIDEAKCNGCGECITACAEGALKLVDGKAKLVKEEFCDGFGDCIGECPTGALTIETRDAGEFDYQATKLHVLRTQGVEGVQRLEAAGERHGIVPKATHAKHPGGGGCPGTRARTGLNIAGAPSAPVKGGGPAQVIRSDLNQWPVQLHLVRPGLDAFKNKELVVMSTCGPIASADAHWRFIRGRSVVVACPKLDRTEGYVEKLAAILSEPTIPKVIVVRMEVPCCGGLTQIATHAVEASGRGDLVLEEAVLGVNGDFLGVR